MSEISHHRSILTLSHVQGLGHSPQDIKAPIPMHRKSLALASNLNDKILLDMKQKESNSPFNLGHFPVFQDENMEEINVKTYWLFPVGNSAGISPVYEHIHLHGVVQLGKLDKKSENKERSSLFWLVIRVLRHRKTYLK